ncbi:MAG: ABC transporter ATP-binding protein [Burkholderiaceae bacterium]|nr:ABC transporter ATP-binding protein [Burkholderiaceae bacterium]
MIAVEGLSKTYRMGEATVRALDEVTVAIATGEMVAVMGPSGSGKSTFMNMIGCLDRPDQGRYRLAGTEVSALDADQLAAVRNLRIGFVFQQFNLLPRTSALENVALPLLYAGVEPRERSRRARERLAAVGLGSREAHTPTQLSGGQQQRVAIARALVNSPAILLADEPTGALDSRTSLEVMALFQSLNRDGQTVVLVTHEPDIASFASRVIGFLDGRIVSDKAQVPRDAAVLLERAQVSA